MDRLADHFYSDPFHTGDIYLVTTRPYIAIIAISNSLPDSSILFLKTYSPRLATL